MTSMHNSSCDVIAHFGLFNERQNGGSYNIHGLVSMTHVMKGIKGGASVDTNILQKYFLRQSIDVVL